MLDCPDLAVPSEVMQHVVNVESSRNPFAIGVVGGYLAKQPSNLEEALAAVRQLKAEGYNFSVGIAQVNRYNLAKYGLPDYASAFQACPNLRAGSRILRECYDRAQDWGKAFSCYYSGNFVTGFDHGYVQKIFASIRKAQFAVEDAPKAVRIIPYNSKVPRKIARDEGLPIAQQSPVQPLSPPSAGPARSVYPEPYAIRRYVPSTPLDVTAAALAHGSPLSTAESRAAIPVPGPGAQLPDALPAAAPRLPEIPLQVVGIGGDPYKTRLLLQEEFPRRGEALPLPSGASHVHQSRRGAGRTSGESEKGGLLVHADRVESQPNPVLEKGTANSEVPLKTEAKDAQDRSFVF